MLGFVLMGLDIINSVLRSNNILLANGIKNGFDSVKLVVQFKQTWTNSSTISPVVLVILASIIIIVIYLYMTSELLNKKKLIWILAIVIFIFILGNSLLFLKKHPSTPKSRLTILPLQTDSALTPVNWIGDALWQMIPAALQHSVLDQGIILPAEWTKSIIKIDSIHEVSYLTKLSQKVPTVPSDYFLIGKLSGHNSAPDINYQLLQATSGQINLTGSHKLVAQELPKTMIKIRDEILIFFNIKIKKDSMAIKYIIPEAYQNYLAGQHSYQQNNYQDALNLSEQALQIDSSLVDAFLLAGKSCFMKAVEEKKKGASAIEEFEQAKALLSHAIALDSTNVEAYTFLGKYYIYRERWSLAEAILSNAYRLNPNNPQVYLALSRLHQFRYRKLGFKNEEQLFKRAIFLNPYYEDAYLMLSDYYLFSNERDKAIHVLEKFLEINPNAVSILMALGKIYLIRSEMLKIIDIYNRIIELDPDNSDAYYNLGILYYNSKDYDTAEKLFLRATAIDNHLNANLYLAYIYEAERKYEQAIEFFRRRVRYGKGFDDEFAEEARKHLYKLMHDGN